jgi:hypothetical protein
MRTAIDAIHRRRWIPCASALNLSSSPAPPTANRAAAKRTNGRHRVSAATQGRPGKENVRMNAKEVIRQGLTLSHMTTKLLFEDLSDQDLLVRVAPDANHLAWQLGHLISSENQLVNIVRANAMPPLPETFVEKHKSDNAKSDNSSDFLSRKEYLDALERQREGTLKVLEEIPDAELDAPAPETIRQIAPTIGAIFVLVAQHETMHASQATPVRRKLGKKVAF